MSRFRPIGDFRMALSGAFTILFCGRPSVVRQLLRGILGNTADDHTQDLVLRGLLDPARTDEPPGLEHGDTVAVLEYMIEIVADQQHREAMLAHVADQGVDLAGLFHAERS